ncbi:MAG: manganese efflux pump MntP family protein [Methanosarcina sp.]|jgi:putative Mn2+ efflux pump MntP|nr:manganese efflux pump MntP family protein [Methanosarcina sp.]MDD3317302.1 manganese efflux pump MntP family protein [Methanosarcina sp.]MDD4306060.1 manganese efflux pump MntP family protein [Methanosarcina sp.]MDD4619908.1 manganese efflux pump MntP family protein [Methanosarcina sp.]NLN43525.1 manganese efflux pump MntP family protein [Methanosarcina sp.]
MSFLTNFLLALGLSMDAFAVSMSSGTTIRPFRLKDALKLAFFFGGFQAFMPVLGWLGGSAISGFISDYAPWIAFGLLVFIGGKMIYEALYGDPEGKLNSLNYSVLLVLSIATSIDALAVGISFAFLNTPILEPAIIIGCVTFFVSLCGAILGYRIGHFFEHEVEIIGGLILIGLGGKILAEHLFWI